MHGEGVDGGWVLLSTKILESPIFHGPPDLLKLWLVLLCKAHRHAKPFRLLGGREVQRGALVTSLGALQEHWRQGGKVPSRKTVGRWMDTLVSEGMIECVRSRNEGTWVRIMNFEKYQDFESYKIGRAHSKVHSSAQPEGKQKRMDIRPGSSSGAQQGAHECTSDAHQMPIDDSDLPITRKNKNVPDDPGPAPIQFNYKTDKWNRRPTPEEMSRWKAAFPAVKIVPEIQKATVWLIDNKKKKRKVDFPKFLFNWFAREQSRCDARTR